MHYVFALATAFLATAVAANPAVLEERGVNYEYKIVTVTKTDPEFRTAYGPRKTKYFHWRKSHGRPSKHSTDDQDSDDQDSTDDRHPSHHIQYYGDFPKPGEISSSHSSYYGEQPKEEQPKEEQPKEKQPKEKQPKKQPKEQPSEGSDVMDECLKVHNEKRAIHGVGPLTWDVDMANHANSVCQTCKFEHSKDSPYGENLAGGYQTATLAIEDWYNESAKYNYANGDFGEDTGHFTQMVWKAAKAMGCASCSCDSLGNGVSGNFLTCNYDTGNVRGKFQENVLPPKSS